MLIFAMGDLTWPLRQKKYDKRAGRIMIAEFRRHYFGERAIAGVEGAYDRYT